VLAAHSILLSRNNSFLTVAAGGTLRVSGDYTAADGFNTIIQSGGVFEVAGVAATSAAGPASMVVQDEAVVQVGVLRAEGNPPCQILIDGARATAIVSRLGSADRGCLLVENGLVDAVVLGPWGGHTLINGGRVTLAGTDAAVLFETDPGDLRFDGGTVIFAGDGDIRYLPDTRRGDDPADPPPEQNIVISGVANFITNGIIDFARTGTPEHPRSQVAFTVEGTETAAIAIGGLAADTAGGFYSPEHAFLRFLLNDDLRVTPIVFADVFDVGSVSLDLVIPLATEAPTEDVLLLGTTGNTPFAPAFHDIRLNGAWLGDAREGMPIGGYILTYEYQGRGIALLAGDPANQGGGEGVPEANAMFMWLICLLAAACRSSRQRARRR
jgi:hypothetical protein